MTLESQMIIIFGATGDLTKRKLIPALYHLLQKNLLTSCTPLLCVGRRTMSRSDFIRTLSIDQFISAPDPTIHNDLLDRLHYIAYDQETDSPADFKSALETIENRYGCTSNKLIYLALPTTAFEKTVHLIGALSHSQGWRRIVFEKPFGVDHTSAQNLDEGIKRVLKEDEIYRVDHYLGKELVQNILTLRFANEVFSGAWHKETIDHIQITVSEKLGVEKRAGYYDKSGAVRDMLQNHLLQLLCLVAMEPPAENKPDGLRDEAVSILKRLRDVRTEDIVLGQYGEGIIDGNTVVGYREEDDVSDTSTTETYAAVRTFVDTERWDGVPFYLRTGKRLNKRYAEIRIVFKKHHRHIIGADGTSNMIIIRIQPNEGIACTINVQKPGQEDQTTPVMMDFCHHCYFGPNTPEAYESILRNVMEGDHSLFPRKDWIEASWNYIDRLRSRAGRPVTYPAGTSGPVEADSLLAVDNRRWITDEPEPLKLS